MTKQSMLRMLRMHLNDEQSIGWEFDDELIEFLDRSCDFLSNLLITMKHTSMIKALTVDGPTDLPSDFVGFVGKLPIQIAGNQAVPYGRIDNQWGVVRWDDPNIPREKQGPTWQVLDNDTPNPSWEAETTNDTYRVLYWAKLPYVSSFLMEDTLPYKNEFASQIIDVARMLALNKNEYDISQDVSIQQQVQTALSAVVGDNNG